MHVRLNGCHYISVRTQVKHDCSLDLGSEQFGKGRQLVSPVHACSAVQYILYCSVYVS